MSGYVLKRGEAPDFESSRLTLLEQLHDPVTVSQLDAIGVGEGWRCLDVGAGGGSVARMLADRVGRGGSVLAVDLDTTLLERMADDRIDVRRLDLLADPLPSAAFDLVHARNLLMHLPSRLEALARLVAALRPGGWILVSDPDFTTVTLNPSSPAWERVWSAFLDAIVAAGWDPRYGARLVGDLGAAGLVDLHAEHLGRCRPGGSSSLLAMTIERVRGRMVALGAASDEIDEAERLLADPERTVHSPTICVARARRPQ